MTGSNRLCHAAFSPRPLALPELWTQTTGRRTANFQRTNPEVLRRSEWQRLCHNSFFGISQPTVAVPEKSREFLRMIVGSLTQNPHPIQNRLTSRSGFVGRDISCFMRRLADIGCDCLRNLALLEEEPAAKNFAVDRRERAIGRQLLVGKLTVSRRQAGTGVACFSRS